MIPRRRIYISASKDQYLNSSQKAIKDAIFRRVEANYLEPWGFFKRGPLKKGWGFKEANAAMSRCQGAIVLAFAQWECVGLEVGEEYLAQTCNHESTLLISSTTCSRVPP